MCVERSFEPFGRSTSSSQRRRVGVPRRRRNWHTLQREQRFLGRYWSLKCKIFVFRFIIYCSNFKVFLLQKIQVDKKLQSGIRVTVKKINGNLSKLRGLVVSPEMPRTQNGLYWGYQVRYASSFRKILSGNFLFNH